MKYGNDYYSNEIEINKSDKKNMYNFKKHYWKNSDKNKLRVIFSITDKIISNNFFSVSIGLQLVRSIFTGTSHE